MKTLDIEKLMKQFDGYSVEEVAEALLDYAANQEEEKEKKLEESFLTATRATWEYLHLLCGEEVPKVDDKTLLGFKEIVDGVFLAKDDSKDDFGFFFKTIGL